MNQSKKTKVLVFSPHPDDLYFGCSGAVAKWTKEGQEVYYCIISGGCKGSNKTKVSEIELRKIREGEQKKAAGIVGAKKVIFLREKDGELENTKELRKKLVKVIREVKPDIVLIIFTALTETIALVPKRFLTQFIRPPTARLFSRK